MPGNLVPETVPKLFTFTFGILGSWKSGGLLGILRKASEYVHLWLTQFQTSGSLPC